MMGKWILAVLILVAVSVMTSGLISALADLAAFLLLLYTVARKAVNKAKYASPSHVTSGTESSPCSDRGQSDKIDIVP
ncbi:hypothetical protein [Photobacterium atrarenae]|uniref:DUF1328 domain-containing protein n=1 Tax=Photobacterium atrarenae TaxID=865757 RepID=A0ABY5GL24_9GAMM|nr:hypothetical protein [Photobacterium atrarenae]UTV30019.1 hypothetical protein NNL38_23800 [Photobacterium atrarenae]